MKEHEISEELWAAMEPLLPAMRKRRGESGRTPRSYREIMEAIFWILRTGAQWSALPKEQYPPKSTVHDRFQYLVRDGFFERLNQKLARQLLASGVLNLEECFIDGTFVVAKKGGLKSVQPGAEKARRSWRLSRNAAFR